MVFVTAFEKFRTLNGSYVASTSLRGAPQLLRSNEYASARDPSSPSAPICGSADAASRCLVQRDLRHQSSDCWLLPGRPRSRLALNESLASPCFEYVGSEKPSET